MTAVTEGKIKFSEKLGFIMANLGNIPVITFISVFLMIFYTNVVGLKPAQVATLFLIARIIDAVNDPLVGYFIDHTPVGKMGRFRRSLIFGAVICGLNYLLLWFGPIWMPGIKLLIVYISYLLIGITFPIMDISLNSLLPVMTDNLKERNSLSTLKGFFYMVGAMIFNVTAPIAVASGSINAYYKLIFSIVAFVIFFSVVGALLVREHVAAQKNDSEKYKFKDIFRIFSIKPVLFTFLSMFIGSIGLMMYNTTNTYYFSYIIGDLSKLSIVMLASMVGIIPAMLTSQLWINRFGKKAVFVSCLILMALGLLIRFVSLESVRAATIASVVYGFGMGGFLVLMYSIQADNTNYVEYIKNIRVEAAIASLSSFTTKFSQGIGGAIPGYILAATCFDGASTVQPDSALKGIIVSNLAVPAAIILLAGIIFAVGYDISGEKLVEVNTELIRRHNKLPRK